GDNSCLRRGPPQGPRGPAKAPPRSPIQMSNLAPPRASRESAVLSAQPEQLIVMLYDGARRFLHQAAIAMGEGQVELAHRKLRRTEDILLHLREVLDKEQGGEIATRLESIYLFCQSYLLKARL